MSTGSRPSPVQLELLRTQLQSIADESAETVERTAISPIVTEGKDYGSVLLNADGDLIAGGGVANLHWVAATRAIRATIARYGDTIVDGDVYLANDPYNGGGLHPADVMVQRPIFVDGVRVAWSALSAHLVDMGGMAVGSWSPHATECFQEAFRIPPVRLLKAGEEVSDVWDLFRINVRFSALVEMDLRGLVAGSFVAQTKLQQLVRRLGVEEFNGRVSALLDLSEREVRRRIRMLEPGQYRSVGWTEWGDEFVITPVTMTVEGDRLVFDFEGSHEQIPFFINSKPYIVKTLFMNVFTALFVPDLPFNEGVLRPVELICPEGSVVNSVPPAPMNCGHMHLGMTAAEVMNQCLRQALWASAPIQPPVTVAGYDGTSGIAPNSYWGSFDDGQMEAWMMIEGLMMGQCGSPGRDGIDYSSRSLSLPERKLTQPTPLDIEMYEMWYPVMVTERRSMTGTYGAGQYRSGASLLYTFEPYGGSEIGGQMLGFRGRLPLGGTAGGSPGCAARFRITKADGTEVDVAMNASNVQVLKGESFTMENASAGGWGDPLDRDPVAVSEDVADGRMTAIEALHAYGVVLDGLVVDAEATATTRASVRAERLRRAEAPAKAVSDADAAAAGTSGDEHPLYPGVVQRGNVAYAIESGQPLAVAPSEWYEGCPVLRESACGGALETRTFLDPKTGRSLLVEMVPTGYGRVGRTMPARWAGSNRPLDLEPVR